MKKTIRLIIISVLLLTLFLPLFDYYLNQNSKETITMAQEVKERNVTELNRLAEQSFYDGNYKSAINYYKEIINVDPKNIKSRRNLAVLYNDINDLKSENKILLETAILSSDNHDYLNLAINFYELNNNLASNFLLENKINENKLKKRFLFNKYLYTIKNYLDLSQFKKAEEYLMKITNLKINMAEVYLLSAELNKLQGNYQLAYNDYYDSYKSNRSQTYLFRNMAEMLEKDGKEIKAYNHWQRTLSYNWFKDLAYQKINQYQEKYPQLKEDKDETETEPETIDPFSLEPKWIKTNVLAAQEDNQKLRIGIEEGNQHLLFQYKNEFSIINKGKIIFRGKAKENYLLEIENKSLYISDVNKKIKLGSSTAEYEFYTNQNNGFYVYNINYGQGYFWQGSSDRQYRGNMIIKGEGTDFTLINKIELTPYLLSVVPSEIYASWPEESLKAQAVAARSYTLNNLNRHKSSGYDLCASVHCAAYNGVQSEHQNTTNAVLATQGESAYFENKIIEAVFSSNSGGYTERSDQIWSADLVYLRGSNQMKNDFYKFPLNPIELRDWLILSPPSYSKDFGSSNYRWQQRVPVEIIEYRTGIKSIKKVQVLKRSQGGTITQLQIEGDSVKKYSVSQIRRIMGGLKSSRFYFNSYFDAEGNLKELYLYGSGWGHNLGLDQSASAGMGKDGYSYQQIIKHFYPGVEIKKIE